MNRIFIKSAASAFAVGTYIYIQKQPQKQPQKPVKFDKDCECIEYCYGSGYISTSSKYEVFGHDGYECRCDCYK